MSLSIAFAQSPGMQSVVIEHIKTSNRNLIWSVYHFSDFVRFWFKSTFPFFIHALVSSMLIQFGRYPIFHALYCFHNVRPVITRLDMSIFLSWGWGTPFSFERCLCYIYRSFRRERYLFFVLLVPSCFKIAHALRSHHLSDVVCVVKLFTRVVLVYFWRKRAHILKSILCSLKCLGSYNSVHFY